MRFGDCFLRVRLMYKPLSLVPCHAARGTCKIKFTNSTVQFIFALSNQTLKVNLSRTLIHDPCVSPRNLAVAALESSDKRISAPTLPQDGGKE